MRVKRFVLACSVLFVLAIAWNGLVHLVLLRSANAVVRHLYRPDLADRMWLSLLVTAAMVVVFVWGYSQFARVGSFREAVGYGTYFAIIAGVLVDLNQYVLYPIPGWLALLWFLGGLVEFNVYAIIVNRLYPPSGGER
jgi:hypothetical protein